ncbi:hypothetical protein FSP39_003874 [Pinctada imbricata]|uniref:Uncharacterized protein n=1 Tax=Pinctada imbricata TaxID=66713 RepID=A0AA89BPR7_PINIB|nr:hypothetical protein FSP39_003874 [Pinctada imbricata]
MCDSTSVLSHLRSRTSSNIVILGDTSYGSSLYTDKQATVVVFYDTVYSYATDTLAHSISRTHSNTVISKLCIPESNKSKPHQLILNDPSQELSKSSQETESTSSILEDSGSESKKLEISETSCNNSERVVCKCGRSFILSSSTSIDECEMFYIGKESLTLTNLMMTFNKCKFSSYDPELKTARKESLNVNKALMKRYYMIERAKDARIVGIVVGTLGVAQYLQVINRLKSFIDAGR